eukprot:TRINITY_DN4579_c0_g1_i1.p1 TRINITY_DN4579_c0_g1~~TRINITY_DN4579_c0_g1_i1.p1  ORF type:complete len:937 (+),score=228.03 TRINITY_DN4579_c0_g1_i1:1224-4034(+)
MFSLFSPSAQQQQAHLPSPSPQQQQPQQQPQPQQQLDILPKQQPFPSVSSNGCASASPERPESLSVEIISGTGGLLSEDATPVFVTLALGPFEVTTPPSAPCPAPNHIFSSPLMAKWNHKCIIDLMNFKEKLTITCHKTDGRFVGRTVVDLGEFRVNANQLVQKNVILKSLVSSGGQGGNAKSPPRGISRSYSSGKSLNSAGGVFVNVGNLFSFEPTAPELTIEFRLNTRPISAVSLRRLQINRILEQNKRLNIFPIEQHPPQDSYWKWSLPPRASEFLSFALIGKIDPFDQKEEVKLLQEFQRIDMCMEQLPLFCFPVQYSLARTELQPITFAFSLVNSDVEKVFGNCLMFWLECNSGSGSAAYAPFCICALSKYPAMRIVQNFLSKLFEEGFLGMTASEILASHYLERIVAQVQLEVPYVDRIPWTDFPMMDISLLKFFEVLEIQTVMDCIRAILCECKIIFHSSQISLLSLVCEGLLGLCFPFTWTHIYVPLLPRVLSRFAQAPVPFILGVHNSYLSEILSVIDDVESVVLVDVDRSEVRFDFDKQGIPPFPSALSKTLVLTLRQTLHPQVFQCDSLILNDIQPPQVCDEFEIRAAFSSTWRNLLRGYREFMMFYVQRQMGFAVDEKDSEIIERKRRVEVAAVNYHQDDPIFDSFSFLETVSDDKKPFLEFFLTTQMFHTFVEAHKSSPSMLFDHAMKAQQYVPRSTSSKSFLLAQNSSRLDSAEVMLSRFSFSDTDSPLSNCVRRLFRSESLSFERLCSAAEYLRTNEVRRTLLELMYNYSSGIENHEKPFCLSSRCLEDLSFLVASCLFWCNVYGDYVPAWGLLKAAKRFYRMMDDGFNVEYLYEHLKNAKIWRESRCWESAFDELKSDPSYDGNAFAIIAFLCQSMLSLGLDGDLVTAFSVRLTSIDKSLSEQNIEELFTLIVNLTKSPS